LNNPILYLKTIIKLGISNVLYVAWYRFSLKSEIRKRWFPIRDISFEGDFFYPCPARNNYPVEWKKTLVEEAGKLLNGKLRYYAFHWKQAGNPPDWFLNPFNGSHYKNTNLHWTQFPDFDPQFGDIKHLWEASRFEWVIILARAYSATGEQRYLKTLNSWLRDWAARNPMNTGPNWKCGQEAGIRIFNLINGSLILQQADKPSAPLCDLIYAHLSRIAPNIHYAMAQDNNHGTSEAAALFIGGSWLSAIDPVKYSRAIAYANKGRYWLENRVAKLIGEDGSFSQHSVTYHRLMLDTLAYAEYWRHRLHLAPFSLRFYESAKSAIEWLWMQTDELSGNAPNLGSNDGALVLNMHSCDYRDFRSSIQFAQVLFNQTKKYNDGYWDEPLFWFEISISDLKQDIKIRQNLVLKGGYTILKSTGSWAMVRWPFFRFRPSHNDVLHFDLWHNGINIICDAGTYSYTPPSDENNVDLQSVRFHNTVSFDDHEQMPAISRFLMGRWLKAESISEVFIDAAKETTWSGSYVDVYKNRHFRKVSYSENVWIVDDTLEGTFGKAVIGFNINQSHVSLEGNRLETSFGFIVGPEDSVAVIKESVASDYYFEKHPVFRLTYTVQKPGKYTTKIMLNPS